MSGSSGQKHVLVGTLKVRVIQGSIADQQVDVIVNSSNCSLNLSQGSASKALLDAAGDGIQTECRTDYPNGIKDGEIAITSGGQLSCEAIYHGALSKYTCDEDEEVLKNLINASLDQAETDEYQTIAFPALGTGMLGYPTDRVVEIFFSCIEQASTRAQSLEDVFLVIFPKDRDTFKKFLTVAKAKTAYSNKRKYGGTRIGNVNVKVVVGEMNKVKADVIVCSGPTDLQLSNNGLSQSLSDVAGPEMQDELDQRYPDGIEYGEFAISKGYNLLCRYVYHGALPKWSTTDPDPSFTMEELIDNCLETADRHNTKTIAFPTLGVGSLLYPVEESAQLMGECIRYFCTNHSGVNIKTIIIVVYRGSSNYANVFEEFKKELSGGPVAVSGSHELQALPVTVVSRQSHSEQIGNLTVSLHVGNITKHQVDVIVNSVGSDFSMSSGTAAAIQAAAGPGLMGELEQNYPRGIKEGQIAVAKGYNLKCNEVFNGTLSPWYSKRSSNVKLPEEILEEFVNACLEQANKRNHNSIAFPALGTGYQKFPADVAAGSIVAAINRFSCQQKQKNIKDIRVVLYGGSNDLLTLEKEFKDTISQSSSGRNVINSPVPVSPAVRSVPPRGTPAYLQYKCTESQRTPSYWTKITPKKSLKDWNLQEKSGKYYFLTPDQQTYNCIENAFQRTIGHTNAQVVSIQRIENASLFMKYGDECQRLFRKVTVEGTFTPPDRIPQSYGPVKVMSFLNQQFKDHTHSEINEYYFFHATKPDLVNVICGQGLDSRLANERGRLGTGVYGAEEANKSHQYAGCDQQNRYPMFLVRMGLGDIFLTQRDVRFKRPPCKVCTTNVCLNHQELHDSVMANGGDFFHREFVVYDRNQSYPEYLIWYTV